MKVWPTELDGGALGSEGFVSVKGTTLTINARRPRMYPPYDRRCGQGGMPLNYVLRHSACPKITVPIART